MGLCYGVTVLPRVQVFSNFYSQMWMVVIVLETAQHPVSGDDRVFPPGDRVNWALSGLNCICHRRIQLHSWSRSPYRRVASCWHWMRLYMRQSSANNFTIELVFLLILYNIVHCVINQTRMILAHPFVGSLYLYHRTEESDVPMRGVDIKLNLLCHPHQNSHSHVITLIESFYQWNLNSANVYKNVWFVSIGIMFSVRDFFLWYIHGHGKRHIIFKRFTEYKMIHMNKNVLRCH